MGPPPTPEPADGTESFPMRERVTDWNEHVEFENDMPPPTPLFPMSPDAADIANLMSIASSPDPLPPPSFSRRPSVADSSAADGAPLTTYQSSFSEISESIFSETSAAPFAELDRKLEQFVLQTESELPMKEPTTNIPTEAPGDHEHAPYTGIHCAFGWTGDEEEDLGDLPTTKAMFQEKLIEAKEGTAFILSSLLAYQAEINSRRHHKFKSGFLSHQNSAIVITLNQLDQINSQLDKVITEVNAIDDNDSNIKAELLEAYKHAAPWVKRTRRVVSDAHVFYKLNYTLGAANKANQKKASILEAAMEADDFEAVTRYD